MRQGQQNRRGRGRGNGQGHQGRKGQNPLTRSFESNGPDVKIRGTPAHIAEKYSALARDAQSSGDPVLAENYLQHAEHYSRIIMAYREQQMAQNSGEMANGSSGQMSRQRSGEAPEANAEGDTATGEGASQQAAGHEPQPRSEGQRFDDRPQRSPQRERSRQDRGDRQDRGEGGFRRGRDRQQPPTHEQPEFLRRSVRRPRRDSTDEAGEVATTAAGSSEDIE